MLFHSLNGSHNDSCLTVFHIEGNRVFQVLILSLVRLGNGFASGLLSYIKASTNRPLHTYYVTILLFVCPNIRTTLATSTVRNNIPFNCNLTFLQGVLSLCFDPWFCCTVPLILALVISLYQNCFNQTMKWKINFETIIQ